MVENGGERPAFSPPTSPIRGARSIVPPTSPSAASDDSTSSLIIPTGGMDCYADDREALSDFARYFNNTHLSDITLLVGGAERFPAHRIVLCRSSDVFDQMLSEKWNRGGDGAASRREFKLTEEPQCQRVFHAFLRFLYANHVSLNSVNALPILVLADKYNVNGLKKVCLDYATAHVLPELEIKELLHVWFDYATKAFHPRLVDGCMEILARHFHTLTSSSEWERDWLALDKDQLAEFLKCSRLEAPSEYSVWEAVHKWLKAGAHPERRSPLMLAQLLPLIRFPHMSAYELATIEASPLAQQHPKLFAAYAHLAYKFIAMPLVSRAPKMVSGKEFGTLQFLLRNYTEARWERAVSISKDQLQEPATGCPINFATKSNSLSLPHWNWSLSIAILQGTTTNGAGNGGGDADSLRVTLTAEDIDHTNRSVEWLLMVVSEKRILKATTGSKMFTKSRYSADLELGERVRASEMLDGTSPFLAKGCLHLQLLLRPVM